MAIVYRTKRPKKYRDFGKQVDAMVGLVVKCSAADRLVIGEDGVLGAGSRESRASVGTDARVFQNDRVSSPQARPRRRLRDLVSDRRARGAFPFAGRRTGRIGRGMAGADRPAPGQVGTGRNGADRSWVGCVRVVSDDRRADPRAAGRCGVVRVRGRAHRRWGLRACLGPRFGTYGALP